MRQKERNGKVGGLRLFIRGLNERLIKEELISPWETDFTFNFLHLVNFIFSFAVNVI